MAAETRDALMPAVQEQSPRSRSRGDRAERSQPPDDGDEKRAEVEADAGPSNGIADAPEKKREGDREEKRERRGDRRDDTLNEAGSTLYVTNVSQDTRSEDLHAHFEKFGPIDECRVINNPVTKESRGFAFLRYHDSMDAQDAMKAMDGKEFEGKILRVETAKRSKPHDPTPGQYKGPTGASVKYDQRGRLKPGYTPYYQLPPSKGRDYGDDRKFARGRDSRHYGSRDEPSHNDSRYYDEPPRGYPDRMDRGDRPSSRHYPEPVEPDPYYDDYYRRGRGSYPSGDSLRKRDHQERPRSRSRDRRERVRRSPTPRRYGRSPYDDRRR